MLLRYKNIYFNSIKTVIPTYLILYNYISQIFGAAVICLSTFNQGALIGYTTIALPQWKNETNVELRFDDNESSLFASSIFMIGIICSPIGGMLSGWLGRRKLVLLGSPFVIFGWLITGFAQNKIMLFAGRIISGGKKQNTFFSCM